MIESLFGLLSLCGIPIVVTILLTITRCHQITAFHRHASYGTLLLGAGSMPLLLVLLASFVEPGNCSIEAGAVTPDGLLTVLCCSMVLCILAALGTVLFSERTGEALSPPGHD